ncbi:MAG: hypothetical protein CMJ75_04425 [Planctomycetaceae bacterium]|nr:hypothetical protein [Planctomycetaceae bacterium]
MKFVEMTGRSLLLIVSDDEMSAAELVTAGVADETVVRVNQHGDIEIRRSEGWDIIGGLLGNYEERIHRQTGCKWA